ncbi:MAG: glycosyltransferase family 1 protein [Actinobacteria bacterium]|nr:glycosyltransferase family 1 protein [Actinomycetota bacterium]
MSGLSVSSVSGAPKVLFITNDFPPQEGGIQSFVEGLIKSLPKESVVVHASSFPDQGRSDAYDQRLFEEFGVVVVRDRQRILLPTPGLLARVRGTMHAHQITRVVFGSSVPLGVLARALRRSGAKKIIAITHGHEVWWSRVPIFARALRFVARHCDHITYLGEFTKKAISSALRAEDRGKLVQLPPGVDTKFFTPGPKSPELLGEYGVQEKLILLCVGRLVQRKGQDVLIDALPEIIAKHPNAHLLIVGSGKYGATLKKKVIQAELGESVTFAGRVALDRLPEFFRIADIFISPTRDRFAGLEVEGLGIVFLEASAATLPVIAGNSGGSPDAVLENRTGLVVDGRNAKSVAGAVITLLDDTHLRTEMGIQGRAWMEASWSWEVIGARFRSLLELNEAER